MTDLQPVFQITGSATVTASTGIYRYFVDCAGGIVNLTLPQTNFNGMHLNVLRNDSVGGGTLNIIPNAGSEINRSAVPVSQPNLAEFKFSTVSGDWFYGINPTS